MSRLRESRTTSFNCKSKAYLHVKLQRRCCSIHGSNFGGECDEKPSLIHFNRNKTWCLMTFKSSVNKSLPRSFHAKIFTAFYYLAALWAVSTDNYSWLSSLCDMANHSSRRSKFSPFLRCAIAVIKKQIKKQPYPFLCVKMNISDANWTRSFCHKDSS